MLNYKEMGLRIRTIRMSQNLTQEQLAEKVDMSNAFISCIERGEKAPSAETLARISSELDASLDWLVFGVYSEERFSQYSTADITNAEKLLQLALKFCSR